MKHSQVEKLFVFGSRAQATGSRRSDLDILAITTQSIPNRDVSDWLHEKYPIVDFFQTQDLKEARSVVNGSVISAPQGINVTDLVGAIPIWERGRGFVDGAEKREEVSDEGVEFLMTIAAPALPKDYKKVVSDYLALLGEQGYPNTHIGYDWVEIGERLSGIIRHALDTRGWLTPKAKRITTASLRIESEYDFQNFVHLVLRPWLVDMEPEGVTIRVNGQDKRADFHVNRSRVVIEAKYFDDANSRAAVSKSLEGLKSFYQNNANVRLLLFWIATKGVNFDKLKLERTHSCLNDQPMILVKCFNV